MIRIITVVATCLMLTQQIVRAAQITTYTSIEEYNQVIFNDQIMWASTNGGLVRRDLDTDSIRIFTTMDGLPQSWITGVAERQGDIWVSVNQNGLYKMSGTSFEQYPSGRDHEQLWLGCTDNNGRLWSVFPYLQHVQAAAFDGAVWTVYDSLDGLPKRQKANTVHIDNRGRPVVLSSAPIYTVDYNDHVLTLSLSVLSDTGFTTYTTTCYAQQEPMGISCLKVTADSLLWIGSHGSPARFTGTTWETFTISDGAPDQVEAITQTPDGTVWIAGLDSVFTYDGATWQGMAHPYPALSSIAIDSVGRVWVGATVKSVRLPDGTRIKVGGLTYRNDTSWVTPADMPQKSILDLAVAPDGDIWVGTAVGAYRISGTKVDSFNLSNGFTDADVNSITFDEHENVWFGTDNGLWRFEPDSATWDSFYTGVYSAWRRIEKVSRAPSGAIWCAGEDGIISIKDAVIETVLFVPESPNILRNLIDIEFDLQGRPWIASSGMIARLEDGVWKPIFNAILGSLNAGFAYNACVDQDDNTWISTSFGPVRFDGTVWTWYDTLSGLPATRTRNVYADTTGNVWCATLNKGIGIFTDTGLVVLDTNKGLPTNMPKWVKSDANGIIWSGFYKVLGKYDGSGWATRATQPGGGLLQNQVNDIDFDREGTAWIGEYGVTSFDGTSWTNHTEGLPWWKVEHVLVDAKDNIWAGTQEGLAVFDGNKWTVYDTLDGLPHVDITGLAEDADGGIWCTARDLPAVFRDGVWTRIDTAVFAGADGVMDTCRLYIYDFGTGNEGDLLITGHYYSLVRDIDAYCIMKYNTENGFTLVDTLNNISNSIAEDAEDNLWISSYRYFNGTSWYAAAGAPGTGGSAEACDQNGVMWFADSPGVTGYDGTIWQTFTAADGLAYDYSYCISVAPDNAKWIGTWQGLSILTADTLDILDSGRRNDPGNPEITVWPNPFCGTLRVRLDSRISGPSLVEIGILDGDGTFISDVTCRDKSGCRYDWDGRDKEGTAVPRGIYYLLVREQNDTRIFRVYKAD